MYLFCLKLYVISTPIESIYYLLFIGVDAAYFNQLINILKKDNSASLDRTYLFEAINRVFDGDTNEINDFIEGE